MDITTTPNPTNPTNPSPRTVTPSPPRQAPPARTATAPNAAANASAPAAKPAFKLAITRGRKHNPVRVIVHGPAGIGKSTWAANAPDAIFLDLEGGSAQLDVARVENLRTWEDVLQAVHALTTEEHPYRTLVLDTLDRLESWCWQSLCRRANVASIEEVGKGFGKGYVAAYEEFRKLFAMLEALWARRGMHVIVLAHSKLGTVSNPSGPDYSRYSLKVHERVSGLFVEACDAVLFADYQRTVLKDGDRRAKVTGSGARYLFTEEQPHFVAKNRFGLTSPIPLTWDAFVDGVAVGHSPELLKDSVRARIRTLGELRGEDLTARGEERISACANDVAHLIALRSELDSRIDVATAAREAADGTEVAETAPAQPSDDGPTSTN